MNRVVLIIGVVIVAAVALVFVYQLQSSRLTPQQLREEAEARARLKKIEEAEKATDTNDEPAGGVGGPEKSDEEDTATQPDESEEASAEANEEELKLKIKTNKGDIELKLFPKEAPLTVANFLNLATRGYYDGLTFHRVIADFMIQGGCPLGTGTGDPGYRFEDEFDPSLKFDRPGLLAMANAGPGTNGSQFFITHVPTPHLNNRHTIFGEVTKGQDVVDAIQKGDKIEKIEIEGDYSELLEAHKDRIAAWNKKLEQQGK